MRTVVLDILFNPVQFHLLFLKDHGVKALEDAFHTSHPIGQLVVFLMEFLYQRHHFLSILQQISCLAGQVIVLSLQRVQLVLELDGLFGGNVFHEFIAVEHNFINLLLLGHNVFSDNVQFFHLSQKLLLENGKDLELEQLLVGLFHPG